MKTGEKSGFQTTTVHQARLQIYQPTRKPEKINRIIKTEWGTAIVIGKIGQVHADFIESIFYNAEATRELENGSVQLLVDPYKVRMSVGGGKSYSYAKLKEIGREVMAVVIDLNIFASKLQVMGHIIDEIELSTATRKNPLNGGERHLWRVTVARTFIELMRKDLKLNYNPLLLAQIETGVAQAVARHVLTHKSEPNGGWKLDELLEAVGVDKSDNVGFKNKRADVRKDAENLERVGVVIDGRKIRKRQ